MYFSIFIEPQDLTKSGIANLTERIANSTDFCTLNPCAAYAASAALAEVAAKLQARVKDDALAMAEEAHQQQNCQGAEVIVSGLPFQVKHTSNYDFTKKAAWKACKKVVLKCEGELKRAKVALKSVEDQLALDMKPASVTTSLAFTPKDA